MERIMQVRCRRNVCIKLGIKSDLYLLSFLEMEAAGFIETLETIYRHTWHNLKD
jgi:hypothetical protein